MKASVSINVVYAESEIKRALTHYLLHIYGLGTYALIVYPIIAAAIVLSLVFAKYAFLSVVYAAGGYILYYIYYQRPMEGYCNYYKRQKERAFCFSDEIITAADEDSHSQYLWNYIKKAHESPSAFLLIDGNRLIYIFPKSCFSDEADIEQLRAILSGKFPGFGVNK